jgi:hypothetical protein
LHCRAAQISSSGIATRGWGTPASVGGKPGGTAGSIHGLGYLFGALRREGLIADELVLQLATFLRSLDLFLELTVRTVPRTLTANQVRRGGKQGTDGPELSRIHSSTCIHGTNGGKPQHMAPSSSESRCAGNRDEPYPMRPKNTPGRISGKGGLIMESSHRHLRITPGEWDAFMDDLAQTLDKFAVPAAERAEVVAIVESTRRSIVT